jgi:hypothetical protein
MISQVLVNTLLLLLPLLAGCVFILFVYGLLVFLSTTGDELSKAEGKKKMAIGGVLFAVVAVLWTVAKTAQETLMQ